MEIEELRKLADSFFEWPTEDRSQVTLTSALLFAQHVLRMTQQQAEPVAYGVTYNKESGYLASLCFNKRIAEYQCNTLGGHIVPLYTAQQAQPAPITTREQTLVEALTQEFPLFDDNGLDETEHHCEWAMQQDRKRLHHILAMCSSHQPTGLKMPPAPGGSDD